MQTSIPHFVLSIKHVYMYIHRYILISYLQHSSKFLHFPTFVPLGLNFLGFAVGALLALGLEPKSPARNPDLGGLDAAGGGGGTGPDEDDGRELSTNIGRKRIRQLATKMNACIAKISNLYTN